MAQTRRSYLLAKAEFAGYHNDAKEYTRLQVERGRIASFDAIRDAFNVGWKKKQNGMGCKCYFCTKGR